jgi:tetratricopeptide (TPR) repeat protein
MMNFFASEHPPSAGELPDTGLMGVEMKPGDDSYWVVGLRALVLQGDAPRIEAACRAAFARADARGRLAAAEAAIAIGAWGLAVRLGRSLRFTTIADAGWIAASVAAWAAGRSSLGGRLLSRATVADRAFFSDLWIRAEAALLVDRQRSARIAGKDPSPSVLRPLLTQSLAVLDRDVEQNPNYADLHYHRGMCLSGLGLLVEAREELTEALRLNPHYERARAALVEAADDRASA